MVHFASYIFLSFLSKDEKQPILIFVCVLLFFCSSFHAVDILLCSLLKISPLLTCHLFPLVSCIRHEFDSEQIPDLTKDVYIQDIHCVGSLCKLYFRELPNPLLTYQLYEKFSVSTCLVSGKHTRVLLNCTVLFCFYPRRKTFYKEKKKTFWILSK